MFLFGKNKAKRDEGNSAESSEEFERQAIKKRWADVIEERMGYWAKWCSERSFPSHPIDSMQNEDGAVKWICGWPMSCYNHYCPSFRQKVFYATADGDFVYKDYGSYEIHAGCRAYPVDKKEVVESIAECFLFECRKRRMSADMPVEEIQDKVDEFFSKRVSKSSYSAESGMWKTDHDLASYAFLKPYHFA